MNSLQLVCTEELTQGILRFAQLSQRAHTLAGVETTVVIVAQDAEGKGTANVYVNGALQEVPMEMMMFASEAYQKTMRFARGVHKENIKPEERGG